MDLKCRFLLKSVITFLVVFMLFGIQVFAAMTGKITGRIVDKSSGERLPGVNILIDGTKMGAVTYTDGSFFIINIPPGTYTLRATMMGYKTYIVNEVRVKIDQTTIQDFKLEQSAIQGQEVTIVAARPIVELDLTASKQVVSAKELKNSWVGNMSEAVNAQSGVNINGGIRGGFGLDVNYIVDGQSVRDGGANSALVPVNLSSVQEMEVLTGGWNAEYPQANSGIVNIVTKSGGSSHHGNIRYRVRPSGKYHWGRNVYSKDNYEWWSVLPDGKPGLNSVAYWTTNTGGNKIYQVMTPEQRLAKWQQFITPDPTLANYDKRTEWELEGSVSGPVPLVKNLSYFASARWQEGVGIYPGAYKYQPLYNAQIKLDYRLTPNNRIILSGMNYWMKNAGASRTPYVSSEDVSGANGNPRGFFYSPYNVAKFAPWGGYGYGGGESLGRIQPPERMWQYQWQAKWTHTFSPKSFLDVAFQHLQFRRSSDFLEHDEGYHSFSPTWGPAIGAANIMANGLFVNFGAPNDQWFDQTWTRNNTIKVDFLSQVSPHHQIKAGGEVSLQYFRRVLASASGGSYCITNNIYTSGNHPWEVAAYLQDKIEIQGMIVNAGVRMDMFNGNDKVNYTIFDPLGQFIDGKVHMADFPYRAIAFTQDSPYAVHTPTQVAISPRIGISHPISSTTVLHFMYGHFNQRPGWIKILGENGILQSPLSPSTTHDLSTGWRVNPLDPSAISNWTAGFTNHSNPRLTYERYIQYEIGFEQNISNVISFDLTMYYKDGKNLTSLGYQRGYAAELMDLTTGISTSVRPDSAVAKSKVGNLVVPINGAYSNSRGLEFTVDSRFSRIINLQFVYNMSFSLSDKYGPAILYREINGTKAGVDTYFGGKNTDMGNSGNTNERWNPHNTIKLAANLIAPDDFGPAVGNFRPLSAWYLNLYYRWASGRKFTYHSVAKGDYSSEPNNMTWKPYNSTNLKAGKVIKLLSGLKVDFNVTVINLFNQKQLRLLSGTQLADYMEYGKLPNVAISGEPDVWNWYEQSLTPRQMYFGIGFEF